MANVTVADQVKAPADKVWELIGPFGSIARWLPVIKSAEVEGEGPGAVRVLTTADGGKITDRLMAENPDPRGYTYSTLTSPFPIRNFVSTIVVVEEEDGTSTVSWVCTFEAVGADEDEVTRSFAELFKGGIANIKLMTEVPEGPTPEAA